MCALVNTDKEKRCALAADVKSQLVCKAHRLCVSLNSRLESNQEEEKFEGGAYLWGVSMSHQVVGIACEQEQTLLLYYSQA